MAALKGFESGRGLSLRARPVHDAGREHAARAPACRASACASSASRPRATTPCRSSRSEEGDVIPSEITIHFEGKAHKVPYQQGPDHPRGGARRRAQSAVVVRGRLLRLVRGQAHQGQDRAGQERHLHARRSRQQLDPDLPGPLLRRRGRDHLRRGVAGSRPRPAHVQATILTLIAGIADAVGYITMGGVFAANMTGNTVLAGIAARRGPLPRRLASSGAAGRLLPRRHAGAPAAASVAQADAPACWSRRRCIAVVGFLPIGLESAVLVLALAMGVQASAITQFGGNCRQHRRRDQHAGAHRRRRARPAVARREAGTLPVVATPRLLVLTWVGYLVGAVAGGAAAARRALSAAGAGRCLLVAAARSC